MCEDFYTFSYVSGCCEIALEIFSGFHIDGPAVFDLSIANNITLQVKFRNLDDENRGVMPYSLLYLRFSLRLALSLGCCLWSRIRIVSGKLGKSIAYPKTGIVFTN